MTSSDQPADLQSGEAQGMTILVVHHVTKYRYKKPLRLGEHRLMFRPRDSFDQRLLHADLTIFPQPARLRWIHDAFGNCVTLFDVGAESNYLEVASLIRLDHTPENAPDFQIEDHAKWHPFAYEAEQRPDLEACTQRHHPDPEGSVQTWLGRFLNIGKKQPTGRLLMTLNEAIAQGFIYVRRSASGIQSPAETLRSRSGSCRDFALLMMEAARLMGFAARFVTGYIYVPDRDGPGWLGGGSTHAWCQIYLPGAGWVEFDPTNGIVGNRDLIRVAVARTPEQAIPLSGVYWGDRGDELGMEIEVNVKSEGRRAPPTLSAATDRAGLHEEQKTADAID
jgi:transglutaminase-like putative cysteine protease